MAEMQIWTLGWLWQCPHGWCGELLLPPHASAPAWAWWCCLAEIQPEGERIIPNSMSTPSLHHPHPCWEWEMSPARACTKPPTHTAQEHGPGTARSAGLFLFISQPFASAPRPAPSNEKAQSKSI